LNLLLLLLLSFKVIKRTIKEEKIKNKTRAEKARENNQNVKIELESDLKRFG
jgi:hypothetical protein